MSRWNRPMRRYQPTELVCRECGKAIRQDSSGYWQHRDRVGIKDPDWHVAKP